ncbi:hypothetical protein B0H14DRAFT_2959365 [Mycena olivaceomarginata]|nr:hypothetical protein B0H14DRAFT_2959365 [Mycena olivaceomarginata]
MPPPNNSVVIRVGTTIISALFALWWSVVFSSVLLVSRHFFLFVLCFFLLPHVDRLSTFFFHCLGHLLDDRGSLDLDRVRSLRLACSFGLITRPMLLM